jgi:hypothetical protein
MMHEPAATVPAIDLRPGWSTPVLRRLDGHSRIVVGNGVSTDGGTPSDATGS